MRLPKWLPAVTVATNVAVIVATLSKNGCFRYALVNITETGHALADLPIRGQALAVFAFVGCMARRFESDHSHTALWAGGYALASIAFPGCVASGLKVITATPGSLLARGFGPQSLN